MALLLSVYDTMVNDLISGDTDILSQLRRYRMITAAVERYSRDRPDTSIEDVTGDGGKYYVLSTALDNWTEGFSRVVGIEYPAAAVASDETPTYLEPEDWDDAFWAEITGTQTRHLYLPNHAPAATETMRITYTVPWLWVAAGTGTAVASTGHGFSVNDYVYLDGSTYYAAGDRRIATHQVTAVADVDNFTVKFLGASIPQEDFFAVCNLAAGLCCQAIAAKFAQSKDSTTNIDSAAHASKSTDYAARAQEFIKLYETHLGLNEDTPVKAAGAFVDMDTVPDGPWSREFIFRSRAVR